MASKVPPNKALRRAATHGTGTVNFVWDPRKATENIGKHGIGFEEASTIFLDLLSITGADPDNSLGEARWLTFGVSSVNNFLIVSHVDAEESIRIISARPGTKLERKLYEEG